MLMTLLRSAAGIVVGVAMGIGVVVAGDILHRGYFPLPPGIDITRPDQREALAQAWPWQAFAVMILFWGLSAFVAAAVAGLVAGRGALPAWIAGGVLAAATALNITLIHHPMWVWPAAGASLLIGILAGARLGGRRAAA
mgnify:FL=1